MLGLEKSCFCVFIFCTMTASEAATLIKAHRPAARIAHQSVTPCGGIRENAAPCRTVSLLFVALAINYGRSPSARSVGQLTRGLSIVLRVGSGGPRDLPCQRSRGPVAPCGKCCVPACTRAGGPRTLVNLEPSPPNATFPDNIQT